jgi:hypothetical protein
LVASDITDVKAPFVPAATAQTLLGANFWANDHTVVIVSAPTNASSANPSTLSHGSVSDGFYTDHSGGPLRCIWNSGTQQAVGVSPSSLGRWVVETCRRIGSTYYARTNSTQASGVVTVTPVNPSAKNIYFGRANPTSGPIKGPIWRAYFYATGKSDSDVAAIEAAVSGAYTNRGVLTDVRSGPAWAVLPAEPENLIPYSEQLDNAAWTKRGTATITADAAAGPDGLQTAELITNLGTVGANDFYMLTGIGVAPAGVAMTPGFWLKRVSTTGTLRVQNPNNSTSGDMTVNLASLSDGWEYITPGHPAVSITTAWTVWTNGSTGLLFGTSTGPLSFYIAKVQARLGTTAPATSYVRTGISPLTAGPYAYSWGDTTPRVDQKLGVLSMLGSIDQLTNSLNLCSQTLSNTGSCAASTNDSPFSKANGGTSAKLLTDSDAAARYSVVGAVAIGSAAGPYTTAILVKAGTLSAGSLILTQGAAKIGDCGFSGLGNPATATISNTGTGTSLSSGIYCADGRLCSAGGPTFAGGLVRLVCGATTATAATSVVPSLALGSATTDTGTMIADDIEGYAASYENPPFCPSGVAATGCTADVFNAPASGLPVTTGEISLDYTPLWSHLPFNPRLVSTTNSSIRNGLYVSVNGTSGTLSLVTADATSATTIVAVATSGWVSGQTYHIRVTWQQSGGSITGTLYRDGVSLGSGTTTAAFASHSQLVIGAFSDTSSQAQGYIKNFCVTGTLGACQ